MQRAMKATRENSRLFYFSCAKLVQDLRFERLSRNYSNGMWRKIAFASCWSWRETKNKNNIFPKPKFTRIRVLFFMYESVVYFMSSPSSGIMLVCYWLYIFTLSPVEFMILRKPVKYFFWLLSLFGSVMLLLLYM